jgi:HlyD family secretion protein
MKGKWLLFSGIAILAAILAGALSLVQHESPPSHVARSQTPPPVPQIREVSVPGIIQAQQVVPVPVPVRGTIQSFLAEVGQEVYQGELLAEIKSTELEAERQAASSELERARLRVNSLESRLLEARLNAARARADASRAREELARAEGVYSRQQYLYEQGATPRLTYEQSQKDLDLAKEEFSARDQLAKHSEDRVAEQMRELDEARRVFSDKNGDYEAVGQRLAAAQVLSPVDGLVVSRRGQPGQAVGMEINDLFLIATNLSLLEVVVEPAPDILDRIRPGQEAMIQIAEVPGRGIPGTVAQIQGNRVLVEFIRPSPAVRPGSTAQVRIKLT